MLGKPIQLNCHIMWLCSKLMRSTWHISIVNPAVECAPEPSTLQTCQVAKLGKTFPAKISKLVKVFFSRKPSQSKPCHATITISSVHLPVTELEQQNVIEMIYTVLFCFCFYFSYSFSFSFPGSESRHPRTQVRGTTGIWDGLATLRIRHVCAKSCPSPSPVAAAPRRMNILQLTVTPCSKCNSNIRSNTSNSPWVVCLKCNWQITGMPGTWHSARARTLSYQFQFDSN